MNIQEVISKINSHPEHAKKALEHTYHGKVFIVAASWGYIGNYFKTRRGAEGYIKKQSHVSWYDDYTKDMVNAGAGLQIVEIKADQIIDYKTDKKMWHNWFRDWMGTPHWADNIVQTAKRYDVSDELLAWIEETATEVKETHRLKILDNEVAVAAEEIAMGQAAEEAETSQAITVQANTVTVTMNEQLQGIEIRFNEKPVQEVIEQLKANGFRWSKRGFWYAKQSEETVSFAQSLENDTVASSHNESIEQSYSYHVIDIDDLDQYTVSDELQRRLHSSSMFTVDYKKDCTLTFQQFQNEALAVIALTDNQSTIYYIKKYLQSFKKRYYSQYLKILNHKANNPSWVVTGRGGLNVRRYNKMQDRYAKYLGESVKLSEEFKNKMQTFHWQITDTKQRQWKGEISSRLNLIELKELFTVEKKPITAAGYTETVRTYNYKGYTIAKSWGMFRIFKDGREIKSTLKTTDTLSTAKKYVLMLVQQESESA